MLINGVWHNNITCPKCKYRHPEVVSCSTAAFVAESARLTQKHDGVDIHVELSFEEQMDAMLTRVERLEAAVAALGTKLIAEI